jgi:hypothetical protein
MSLPPSAGVDTSQHKHATSRGESKSALLPDKARNDEPALTKRLCRQSYTLGTAQKYSYNVSFASLACDIFLRHDRHALISRCHGYSFAVTVPKFHRSHGRNVFADGIRSFGRPEANLPDAFSYQSPALRPASGPILWFERHKRTPISTSDGHRFAVSIP